ncbi:MAG: phosphohydrolase [Desulfobacterales bacterium]|nr:phosphohydrolase [Desulfobacterales bacterium]
MKPLYDLIANYYPLGSKRYQILISHGQAVATKAISIAKNLNDNQIDLSFIEEASLIHDIGICFTNTPEFECYGSYPYICHGYLGRELLESHHLQKHALVCERHVGAGISVEDIELGNLPIPLRDMRPQSIEEKIICVADKFFSKSMDSNIPERSIQDILNNLSRYQESQVNRFIQLLKELKLYNE